MTPVFIDANVPIYAAGRHHPQKEPCRQVLVVIAGSPQRFVTSSEVLQELLHHYLGTRTWPQGREVLLQFIELMLGRIEAWSVSDVLFAAQLADRYPQAGGRDLVHAAVMQRLGIDTIVSADRGFDGFAGLRRLDPRDIERWQPLVVGSPG